MAKHKKTFQDILNSVKTEKKHDYNPLEGIVVKNPPFSYWVEKMFFFGGCDRQLRQKTGCFPATLKKHRSSHPVFLLNKDSQHAFQACPCTSQPNRKSRYIKAGCILDKTGVTIHSNSYILKHLSFNLSHDPEFNANLRYMGIVPSECIKK